MMSMAVSHQSAASYLRICSVSAKDLITPLPRRVKIRRTTFSVSNLSFYNEYGSDWVSVTHFCRTLHIHLARQTLS